MGIIYQFLPENPSPENVSQNELENSSILESNVISDNPSPDESEPQIDNSDDANFSVPRKRRKFSEVQREVQSYYRRPVAKIPLLSFDEFDKGV